MGRKDSRCVAANSGTNRALPGPGTEGADQLAIGVYAHPILDSDTDNTAAHVYILQTIM